MSHGSKLVTALESAWSDIRARYPDAPEVVMITGAVKGRRGHFHKGQWIVGENQLPEVFLSGDLFKPSTHPDAPSFGQRVMQTLIHEAAHGRLTVADDETGGTSRGGRYHNKRFLATAVEMGLTKPEAPDPSIGWSDCKLKEPGAWEATIARLNEAERPHRLPAPALATRATRSGSRSSCECACDPARKLSITPARLEAGPILCGVCGEAFE